MNKFIFFILFVIIANLHTSCKTGKDLTYLQDLGHLELQEGIPAPPQAYQIKENDNLYIDILSMNPEINALFNPSKGNGSGYNSGTQQNYGDISSQYLNGFQVDFKGDITMPILGTVKVLGKTIHETQQLIQTEADKYIKDATIKVKLLNFKLTVLGEVKNPGIYYNYNNYITILDGISMASGETDYSHIKKVLVLRQTDKGIKSYRMNLTSSKDLLTSKAYYLQPNDVIYIEPDQSKRLRINMPVFTLIISSISTAVLLLNYLD